MTKEYVALYNFCPAVKAYAKLQEKEESESLFWSWIYQKAICACMYNWNELVHINHSFLYMYTDAWTHTLTQTSNN